MKRIIILLVITQCAEAMLSLNNQRFTLNTHANFGKTHFIAGYTYQQPIVNPLHKKAHAQNNPVKPNNKTKKQQRPYDSAHLIDESRAVQSFFTSRHNIRSIIATVLKQAKKTILIAAFTLTDPGIAQALQKAHTAGIKVEVITDYSNMNKPYSKIKDLVDGHVPVFYYNHALNQNAHQKNARFVPLMHLKLIICDDTIAITGSSNLTKAGQKGNIETITIIRDRQSVDEHVQEFNHLKPLCTMCRFSAEL